ncbi:hypothetical protein V9T40_004893 [Parthenolecanium corni]|uniref:Uncharacterized protein n=1 Tax=Parthenolecanium corni TaxID=536013 RepID=A0AAN9TFA8_9HEMI
MDFDSDQSLKEWAKDKPLSILQLDPADRAVLRIAAIQHYALLHLLQHINKEKEAGYILRSPLECLTLHLHHKLILSPDEVVSACRDHAADCLHLVGSVRWALPTRKRMQFSFDGNF